MPVVVQKRARFGLPGEYVTGALGHIRHPDLKASGARSSAATPSTVHGMRSAPRSRPALVGRRASAPSALPRFRVQSPSAGGHWRLAKSNFSGVGTWKRWISSSVRPRLTWQVVTARRLET